tara:strand:+ start:220 stop:495 length:276 start_codon:yes stop_codon:yes gene_type:complete
MRLCTFIIKPIEAINNKPACLPWPIPQSSLVASPVDINVIETHSALDKRAPSCNGKINPNIFAKLAATKEYNGGLFKEMLLAAKGAINSFF